MLPHTVLSILCNCSVTVLCLSRLAMFHYILCPNQSSSKMPTFSMPSLCLKCSWPHCWPVKSWNLSCVLDSGFCHLAMMSLFILWLTILSLNSISIKNGLLRPLQAPHLGEAFSLACFADLECPPLLLSDIWIPFVLYDPTQTASPWCSSPLTFL